MARNGFSLIGLLVVIAVITVSVAAGAVHAQPTLVLNPYSAVDWDSFGQYGANLHTHTTQSDGSMDPDQVIDEYHSRGHHILVLTDHDRCVWPWESFGRSASEMGLLTVPGNELSRHHHAGSYFCVYETQERDLDAALDGVAALDSLSVIYHPGRYWELVADAVPAEVIARYVAIFNRHPHAVGMEVINQINRYPHDRLLWDALLSAMMPQRPVWGFANDDMHVIGQLGNDWNVFVLENLAEEDLRAAMIAGTFYFSSVSTHPEEDRCVNSVPSIDRIVHDGDAHTITITATLAGDPLEDDAIVWIADGEKVHVGPHLAYRNVTGIKRYVRAELTGPGGTTYTNPFGFSDE